MLGGAYCRSKQVIKPVNSKTNFVPILPGNFGSKTNIQEDSCYISLDCEGWYMVATKG
jgi:hypothetical protein